MGIDEYEAIELSSSQIEAALIEEVVRREKLIELIAVAVEEAAVEVDAVE